MNTRNYQKLDKRLECAAGFVRRGSVVADVGTDHAYLPIYLVANGICEKAIATDINQGPIERARLNIASSGLAGQIATLKTDGLRGVRELEPSDVLILGMGGELIARIISEAEWVKDKSIRLILQPMTHPECVRRYLFDNGFDIVDEAVCLDRKYYDIIVAEYDGVTREYTDIDLLLGKINRTRRDGITLGYVKHLADIYERRVEGLRLGGDPAVKERELLDGLRSLICEE